MVVEAEQAVVAALQPFVNNGVLLLQSRAALTSLRPIQITVVLPPQALASVYVGHKGASGQRRPSGG